MDKKSKEVQERYATDLHKLSTFGLGYIIITFLVYISGFLPNTISVKDIPKYWSMRADDYIAQTGVHQGLSWIEYLNHGDILSFSALAFLSLVSIVTFIAILPLYIKQKDKHYAIITILQVLTLILAASGILTGGGH